MSGEDTFDGRPPFGRKVGPDYPPVISGSLSGHKALSLQTVHDVGHVPSRDQKLLSQFSQGERAQVEQCLQNAELGCCQVILRHLAGHGPGKGDVTPRQCNPEAESLLLKQNQELRTIKMELTTEAKARINQLRLSARAIKLFTTGLLRQAEESLKISELSYTHGETSLINFLDSQRTYFSIMTDYQNSLYAWNADRAALERAIGEDLQ